MSFNSNSTSSSMNQNHGTRARGWTTSRDSNEQEKKTYQVECSIAVVLRRKQVWTPFLSFCNCFASSFFFLHIVTWGIETWTKVRISKSERWESWTIESEVCFWVGDSWFLRFVIANSLNDWRVICIYRFQVLQISVRNKNVIHLKFIELVRDARIS